MCTRPWKFLSLFSGIEKILFFIWNSFRFMQRNAKLYTLKSQEDTFDFILSALLLLHFFLVAIVRWRKLSSDSFKCNCNFANFIHLARVVECDYCAFDFGKKRAMTTVNETLSTCFPGRDLNKTFICEIEWKKNGTREKRFIQKHANIHFRQNVHFERLDF